jgi:hypothetical protein
VAQVKVTGAPGLISVGLAVKLRMVGGGLVGPACVRVGRGVAVGSVHPSAVTVAATWVATWALAVAWTSEGKTCCFLAIPALHAVSNKHKSKTGAIRRMTLFSFLVNSSSAIEYHAQVTASSPPGYREVTVLRLFR